jgi:hypothetical protein
MQNKIYRLTRVQAERLWLKEHKLRGETVIPNMLQRVTDSGGEYLLSTGAKLYRLISGGPKPFAVAGYAYDDSDATKVLVGII